MGVPQMDGLSEKKQPLKYIKMDDLGVPHLWKPPYVAYLTDMIYTWFHEHGSPADSPFIQVWNDAQYQPTNDFDRKDNCNCLRGRSLTFVEPTVPRHRCLFKYSPEPHPLFPLKL